MLEFSLPNNDFISFSHFESRDNCHCSECYIDSPNHRRKIINPDNIKIKEYSIDNENSNKINILLIF